MVCEPSSTLPVLKPPEVEPLFPVSPQVLPVHGPAVVHNDPLDDEHNNDANNPEDFHLPGMGEEMPGVVGGEDDGMWGGIPGMGGGGQPWIEQPLSM